MSKLKQGTVLPKKSTKHSATTEIVAASASFSCIPPGTKPRSISAYIHGYSSVTKDGNQSSITRAIPSGIHKILNHFLNEQFLVCFLSPEQLLEGSLGQVQEGRSPLSITPGCRSYPDTCPQGGDSTPHIAPLIQELLAFT